MVKHIAITIITAASTALLLGCDNSVEATDTANTTTEQTIATSVETTTPAAVTAIDWNKIASTERPADLANYEYPFALDSQNVQNYADYFKVDDITAQHNLTVGMASNEALSKVLDQLSTNYTSHEVTDGENTKLTVHTTANIEASNFDYVFSEPFAKGLVLPIEIKPDGVKSEVDPHGES